MYDNAELKIQSISKLKGCKCVKDSDIGLWLMTDCGLGHQIESENKIVKVCMSNSIDQT